MKIVFVTKLQYEIFAPLPIQSKIIILFSLNILRHAYSANYRSRTSPAVCWRGRSGHEVAITEHSLELFIHKPEDRNKEYKVREVLQTSLQGRFNLKGWIGN